MGAVANMRPDLFRGIVADVPFVDVLTTMSDSTIPFTTGEYTEWGNPAVKDEYFYMKRYSPYDNVVKKDYTNMLITTSYSDSQVQYFEPSKFTAKIREMKTDNNLLFCIAICMVRMEVLRAGLTDCMIRQGDLLLFLAC